MSFSVRPLQDTEAPKPPSLVGRLGSAIFGSSRLLIHVGHQIWARHQQRKLHEQRVNLLKRITVILVTIFCAVLLFAGTARALVALKILNLSSLMQVAGSDLPTDKYSHTNILLLGQGDETHDGIDLTDTIMIASLDSTKTKSAVLLSLPRDLYIFDTMNMGSDRINTLYRDYKLVLKERGLSEEEASNKSMRELADEIGIVLGMEIHHIVKVDFIAFVQAVDAIGGIDIVVPEDLEDPEYPGPNYTFEPFSIKAGPQHLDGETALKYVRTRHTTSDFSRSGRQQQILKAIAEKMQTEGILTRPRQISNLLSIMKEHVATDLTLGDMVSLAGAGKELDQEKIISMQLNTANGLYGELSEPGGLLYNPPRDQFGGAAVILPVSVPEDPITWKRIRLLVQMMIHEREAYTERAPIRIINAGAESGLARRLGGELIRFGFHVITMENAEDDREQKGSVIIGDPESPTAVTVTEILELPFRQLPGTGARSSSASSAPRPIVPLTIELGSDYEYTPIEG